MKIGYNGSTMAHLNYIRREGKYNDREDIIYTETCNLPSWADNSTEFWTAIKDHDLRACRKLEFAIPNEISHEEQIDFAQKFLAEILPNTLIAMQSMKLILLFMEKKIHTSM